MAPKEACIFLSTELCTKRVLLISGLIGMSASLACAADPVSQPMNNPAAKKAEFAQDYGKFPLSFEPNQGQADTSVGFLSRGDGYSLFLTDSSAVLALTRRDASNAKSGTSIGNRFKLAPANDARKTDIVRMQLAGANRATRVAGTDPLPGTANYFIGNDPAKWHRGVPTYGKVEYGSVYPGIDLVYYGNQRQLEYDFVVAPGADPKPIRLQFVGAKRVDLTAEGNLTVAAAHGEIAFHKPVVYQVKDGERIPIDGRFDMLANDTIGFALGRYDHSKPLVIDPVLSYSTYLGGSLADGAYGIAADSSGNAYVVGVTFSTNFPVTTGAFQTANNEPANFECIFVSKLNPAGTALVYSTYLGGSGNPGDHPIYGDTGQAIAVDSSGDAYVTGNAQSTNFPVTTGAFQTVNKTTLADTQNAFVTKLNPTGTALVYSTYLGGSQFGARGTGIAVDSLGDAYVTGSAASTDFPITNGAFQSTNNAAAAAGPQTVANNVFVSKLNPTGTALLYSTFLGGTINDYGAGIAVDHLGDAYVTGQSWSSDFPVAGSPFQPTNNGFANDGFNAFVAKVNPAGTALVYSTFLGGTGIPSQSSNESGAGDSGDAIAVDSSGDAYVTGTAISSNFPTTPGAFQTVNNAAGSVAPIGINTFVTELNPNGSGLLYSTYLGGSTQDEGFGIALDGLGGVYVAGLTSSTNFPVTSGVYQTANAGAQDAFVAKIALSGSGSGPTPTPTPTPTPSGGGGGGGGGSGANGSARLINISTRAMVGTGANILIPGFVISGSGTETLLIRADGPALTGFGVAGALAQPSLSVFDSAGTVVASNTGWGTNTNPSQIASAAATVGAFALASGSADCAVLASLSPGAYTVQVSGVGNSTGVALAEVYEVSTSGTQLANISTRALVGTGANIIIPGFVIAGTGSEELLARADGPALTAFGVGGALAQPSLSVFDSSGNVIASNTGWGTGSNPAQIASAAGSVGAFALTSGSADSALIVNVSAGAYTMQISGVNNSTGVALAEIYEVP
jgi:Beta-propeller repeat